MGWMGRWLMMNDGGTFWKERASGIWWYSVPYGIIFLTREIFLGSWEFGSKSLYGSSGRGLLGEGVHGILVSIHFWTVSSSYLQDILAFWRQFWSIHEAGSIRQDLLAHCFRLDSHCSNQVHWVFLVHNERALLKSDLTGTIPHDDRT